jgi:hypothetical protein
MEAAARQQFYGDTLNIFGCEDHNFQWYRVYSYYSSPPAKKEEIWTSGIARAGCAPEVFDCKELVAWCIEKYVLSQGLFNFKTIPPSLFHHKCFIRC